LKPFLLGGCRLSGKRYRLPHYNVAMQQARRKIHGQPGSTAVSTLPLGHFCSVTPP
jgi:hypothetical protein